MVLFTLLFTVNTMHCYTFPMQSKDNGLFTITNGDTPGDAKFGLIHQVCALHKKYNLL